MKSVTDSYHHCRKITAASGSNFCRAFSLLPSQQRKAMEALYAFARIADDQSDAVELPNIAPSNHVNFSDHDDTSVKVTSLDTRNVSTRKSEWSGALWRRWVSELYSSKSGDDELTSVAALDKVRPALKHTIDKYQIPERVFLDLVDGIDFDQSESIQIECWQELEKYCEQVASSVGIACVAIWKANRNQPITPDQLKYANSCGIAFQLTNILRDLVEDAGRNRCYLPNADLQRFSLTRNTWFKAMSCFRTRQSIDSETTDNIQRIIDIYIEKALGHYQQGSHLLETLPIGSRRIFSLMFSTYFSLLERIRDRPMAALERRVSLTKTAKLKLAATHIFTPLHKSIKRPEPRSDPGDQKRAWTHKRSEPIRVAVVGGGLSGIQAAIDLARHGAKVTLFESKSRLGGRAGSFWDAGSEEYVDYCQHVGMKCCTALRRWISFMGQDALWEETKVLHFVSNNAQPIAIRSWPLPAPFHLGSILLKWPGLHVSDRLQISVALTKLMLWDRKKPLPEASKMSKLDALSWLQLEKQNERSISRFWNIILVSALGELPKNVSVLAMKKVLIDGFARTRDASHLLVPKSPLSELTNQLAQSKLSELGVETRLSTSVKRVVRNIDIDSVTIETQNEQSSTYDAIVVATPWKHAASILPLPEEDKAFLNSIESSPITGVHTWWDKEWLAEPHGIFIDSLCQWVFPAPRRHAGTANDNFYYQIVVSASRSLRGMTDQEISEQILSEIRARYSSAENANLLRIKTVTDPNAVFTLSPKFESMRWQADRYSKDGIYLAGDWTATGWPATMEGALRSGSLAAERLLQRLHHPISIDALHS